MSSDPPVTQTGSPPRPRLRGKLHEAACYVALAAGPALVLAAPAGQRLPVGVYATTLVLLFGVSALYHRVTWSPPARARMRRLDHSMIFLLIAGTYTAVATVALSGAGASWMLPVVWVGAVGGVLAALVRSRDAHPAVTAVPYILLGWVAVAALPLLYRSLGGAVFALLAGGGIAYTVGALAYALRRPEPVPGVFGYHEVFHALVIVGAGCHYAVIALAL